MDSGGREMEELVDGREALGRDLIAAGHVLGLFSECETGLSLKAVPQRFFPDMVKAINSLALSSLSALLWEVFEAGREDVFADERRLAGCASSSLDTCNKPS
jgi:hypothetical protein